jgi:hypothetical protein
MVALIEAAEQWARGGRPPDARLSDYISAEGSGRGIQPSELGTAFQRRNSGDRVQPSRQRPSLITRPMLPRDGPTRFSRDANLPGSFEPDTRPLQAGALERWASMLPLIERRFAEIPPWILCRSTPQRQPAPARATAFSVRPAAMTPRRNTVSRAMYPYRDANSGVAVFQRRGCLPRPHSPRTPCSSRGVSA